MDIERSELELLTDKSVDYKNVRVLYAEISSKWLVAKNPNGNGWIRFWRVLQTLRKQGFEYIDIPKAAYKSRFWQQKGGNDFMMFAYRPTGERRENKPDLSPDQIKHLTRWKKFKLEIIQSTNCHKGRKRR